MPQFAVKLTEVSKKYILRHEKPTLVENIFGRRTREEFWALTNINLTINQGEAVGLIGPNGAGKTTLLEIIAGITTPTTGTVTTRGKVVSLIELNAGFHPDLTGEENIYLNGLLLGMSKTEVYSKLKKIVAFSDIGKFIDAPLYTYSAGMKLRLGFSIAANINLDTLLLDEKLAVGDQDFKEKSFQKIKELMSQGKTIVIVSHFMKFISNNCKRVIWLNRGRIALDSESIKVINMYKSKNQDKKKSR